MSTSIASALRFEIIKRISPGFRHKMMGKMQPIALLSQLIGKKIEVDQKDSEFLLKRLQELKESLKAATLSADDLFDWLNPNEASVQPLNEIVSDCLDLLKMEIYTSNVVFENNINAKFAVKASTFRSVFTACLLTYIDTVEKASKVIISDNGSLEDLIVELTIFPLAGKEDKSMVGQRTFVSWDDIQLISHNANIKITPDQVRLSRLN